MLLVSHHYYYLFITPLGQHIKNTHKRNIHNKSIHNKKKTYKYAFNELCRNELKVDKNAGFKSQHYLLFVNTVVFLIIMFQTFVGYTELYIWRTHTPVAELRRVYISALSHPMSHSKIESNRQFLLKNRSKWIIHLKAGIITALLQRSLVKFS